MKVNSNDLHITSCTVHQIQQLFACCASLCQRGINKFHIQISDNGGKATCSYSLDFYGRCWSTTSTKEKVDETRRCRAAQIHTICVEERRVSRLQRVDLQSVRSGLFLLSKYVQDENLQQAKEWVQNVLETGLPQQKQYSNTPKFVIWVACRQAYLVKKLGFKVKAFGKSISTMEERLAKAIGYLESCK